MKLPQLSLRDLFWLVLVAACLCGWWLRDSRLADRVKAAETELEISQADLMVERAKNESLAEMIADLTTELSKPGTLHSSRRAAEEAWQRIKSRLDPETKAKVEASEEQEDALEMIRLQGIRRSAMENAR
jgi:hypothetical protein